MPSIAFISCYASSLFFRQIPGSVGEWDGYRFTLNKIEDDCVLIAGFAALNLSEDFSLPKENCILITTEPPDVMKYDLNLTNRFGKIIGPVCPDGYEGIWIPYQPSLTWFYGAGYGWGEPEVNLDYDAIKKREIRGKIPKISMVLSSKTITPHHIARLEFAEKLKNALGDKIIHFGKGFETIQDKAEAIDPYCYSLVLENNEIPHFWTEKITDSYLGLALPIYLGCKNIGEYFPEGSYVPIDISRVDDSISIISDLLEKNPWEERLPLIKEARRRVMDEYNLFKVLIRIAQGKDKFANKS